MNETHAQTPFRTGEIARVLDEIRENFNINNVLFSFRDGTPLVDNTRGFKDHDLSTTCASILASAEGLGETLGTSKTSNIITDLEEYTLIVRGCDERTFIALIIQNDSVVGDVFEELDEYVSKIITMYRE